MVQLKWTVSHAVFLPEIDDEHKEIFQALADLRDAHAGAGDVPACMTRLVDAVKDHFAHEERLMRAARYGSARWHRQQHAAARRQVEQFAALIAGERPEAVMRLVGYLAEWLNSHARLADRMMASFLRNQRRGLWKMTIHASTRPVDDCEWVDSRGGKFQPQVRP